MIVKTSAAQRKKEVKAQETWFTGFPGPAPEQTAETKEYAEALREGRIPPNSGAKRTRRSGEVVTYLREGAVVYEDSTGLVETLRAGDFHRTTLGPGFHYQETNASPTHWVHIFQIWLSAPASVAPSHEAKRFASAERRRSLCLVASPDGRMDSLKVSQDAMIYSAILARGTHLVHSLAEHRAACLCVVEGEVRLTDIVLKSGDMALLTSERAVSFSSNEHSEVILLDKSSLVQLQNGTSPQ